MGNTCQSNPISETDIYEINVSNSLHSSKKNSTIPKSMTINVLSYNIFIRPPFVNTNGDDYKDERLAEFVNVIDSFDIICLQEMFSSYSTRKSFLQKKAKEKGFLYSASSPKHDTFSVHLIDGGLQILSK